MKEASLYNHTGDYVVLHYLILLIQNAQWGKSTDVGSNSVDGRDEEEGRVTDESDRSTS